jgi:diguanylate cyclase (GGDEF)-like protein/PAS domain S-box-containing protein
MTRRGSLLIVDDSAANRELLSRRLEQNGYDVTIAACGAEALAHVGGGVYDLVLLDVEMPGMSGLEVLTQLRRTHSQTALAVIMVTGCAEDGDVVEAFRLGANDYVTKPIDFPVAFARIDTHIAHKRAVEKLSVSEERYALAMQGANDGLWDWDLTTNQVYWSERWKGMLGYEESALSSSPDEWFARVHPDDLAKVKDALTSHLSSGAGHYHSEHRLLHRDGTRRWVLCRGAAIRNAAGVATRLAGSFTDITDAKVADGLTGLPNRLLFVDLLERAIKRTQRKPEYLFALLVLGLDGFKAVNNSLGLLTADRLLVAVADRLQTGLRFTDAVRLDHGFTLARFGGDEFAVLLDDISDVSDAVRVAERLRGALESPFEVEGQTVFASASVGIVLSRTGYETAEALLRDGAIALHRAKSAGSGSCEIFDRTMRDRAVARLQLETDLRRALELREFEMHYQPIVSLTNGEIHSFEALVRWRHPERGLVGAAEFIDIAEDTGMILPIGRMVLAEACRQMVEWQRHFGHAAPGVMCVNVSGRQFADARLAADIEAALVESGLAPCHLKLEITESAFLGDLAAAAVTVARVQAMGVKWSLDDFGTGYSSLSYLHRLQVNTVKVDRTFVSGLGAPDTRSEMLRAIVSIAHNLGMDVVAEGVETYEQLIALRRLGCESAQGFHFAAPADALVAGGLIAAQPWRAVGLLRTPGSSMWRDAARPDQMSEPTQLVHWTDDRVARSVAPNRAQTSKRP